MSGIVFFRTDQRERVVEFYTERLGADIWLEQAAGCTICKRDNLLIGFCDGDEADTDGIVTVVVEDRDAVDALYADLEGRAREQPHDNEAFEIYQFFATDPDGRTVEVQTFLHPVPSVE